MFLYNSHPIIRHLQSKWILSFKPCIKYDASRPLNSGGGGGRPRFVVDRRNGKVIYR